MNENDIIKLGRLKFEVIKKHINKNNKGNKHYNYNISNLNFNSKPIFNIDIKVDQYKAKKEEKNNDKNGENQDIINKEEEESEYHETINYYSNKSTNFSGSTIENKSKNNNIINDIDIDIEI